VTHGLVDNFASAFASSAREELIARSEALGRTLQRLWQDAADAWPGIEVEPGAFARFLGDCAKAADGVEGFLKSVRAADLYLTCACVRRDPKALQTLDRVYLRDILGHLSRERAAPLDSDELGQRLRVKLFIDAEGRGPKIAVYGGRGDLRSWLCIVAKRESVDMYRGASADLEDPLSEVSPEVLMAAAPDFGDQEERRAFCIAFRAALRGLSLRERRVLQHRYVHGMSAAEIAKTYGVQPGTVANWLSASRRTLLVESERLLSHALRQDPSEVRRWIQETLSRLEVTLELTQNPGSAPGVDAAVRRA
jgi:RNA polymerase sigma-70 factor, ECF subfamily